MDWENVATKPTPPTAPAKTHLAFVAPKNNSASACSIAATTAAAQDLKKQKLSKAAIQDTTLDELGKNSSQDK
jgi:hypothetical protein